MLLFLFISLISFLPPVDILLSPSSSPFTFFASQFLSGINWKLGEEEERKESLFGWRLLEDASQLMRLGLGESSRVLSKDKTLFYLSNEIASHDE